VFTSTLPDEALVDAPTVSTKWLESKGRDEPVRLVYTGRIVVPKGLFETLDAVAELTKRGRDVEFHIVGWSSPRDESVHHLVERSRQLGIADKLVLDGYRPAGRELLAEIARNDVYLFPTYGEGGVARAIVEAMAVGLPVITTSIRAVEGLLVHEDNALLIEPRSSEAIVAAVERLIDESALRERIASNGKAWGSTLTIGRSVELTVGYLNRLVAESASPTAGD
jgi:glycosyltransferase involved in cell wall biosynthesis